MNPTNELTIKVAKVNLYSPIIFTLIFIIIGIVTTRFSGTLPFTLIFGIFSVIGLFAIAINFSTKLEILDNKILIIITFCQLDFRY